MKPAVQATPTLARHRRKPRLAVPAGARLVEGADGGRQAAVHAEYPVVYER